MLIIRKEQMAAFEEAAVKQFEDQMVHHLQEFAARHCEVIGEDNVRRVIRLGLERSAQYGFSNHGPIQFYLELMFMFGSHFDTDPQLPWATETLTNRVIDDQMFRADRLYQQTMDYMHAVAGPGNAYTLKALKDIRSIARQPLAFSSTDVVQGLLAAMAHAYPQKYQYVGAEALVSLIHSGIDMAEARGMQTARGTVLFGVLMFALGHGFADDALFPWVSRTLQDAQLDDADKRVQKLEARALAYLDRVLAYFGER